jgi:NADH-quinone oxidoreductase subunit F
MQKSEVIGWSNRLLQKILSGEGTKKDMDTIMDVTTLLNRKTICVFASAVATVLVIQIKN